MTSPLLTLSPLAQHWVSPHTYTHSPVGYIKSVFVKASMTPAVPVSIDSVLIIAASDDDMPLTPAGAAGEAAAAAAAADMNGSGSGGGK